MQGNSRRWMWHGLIAVLAILSLVALVTTRATADKDDDVKEGWLGVYIQNVDEDLQEALDLPTDDGVLVDQIVDDSPAEEAGLESGDVILEYDGREVSTTRRLTRWIEDAEPGSTVELKIFRDGDEQTIAVEIGEREEWAEHFDVTIPRGPRVFSFDDDRIVVPPGVPHVAPEPYVFSLGLHSGPHIGVQLESLNKQMAEYFGAKKGNALIEQVIEDSPAEEAGLKAGDVIVGINDTEVDDIDEVREEIGEFEDGDEITVTVIRKGARKEIAVKVAEDEDWSGIGRFREGFRTRPRTAREPLRWHRYEDTGSKAGDKVRDALEAYRDAHEKEQELLEDHRVELEELQRRLERLEERLERLE